MDEILGDIKATGFTLCDEDGIERAKLRMRNGNPEFILTDDAGRIKIFLNVAGDGNPRFFFVDADGKARLGMDYNDDGPSFFLRDASGDVRLGFDYSEATGTATISLASEGGREDRLTLSVSGSDDSARVTLRDNAGRARIEMRSRGDDHSINIINANSVIETLIVADGVLLMSEGNVRTIRSKDAPMTDDG